MVCHKIKAHCFVLCVLGEFSACNTLVRFDMRLLFQQKMWRNYGKIVENCAQREKCGTFTYKKL